MGRNHLLALQGQGAHGGCVSVARQQPSWLVSQAHTLRRPAPLRRARRLWRVPRRV